mmetsp:Transcript_12900/g.17639  ORF Transcript_12900/g.17639 Transcript_12900/m.17639 type:complete len:271 (+) Transcript_12900:147-959(+)|eukprot:CAMPEP_0196595398 /NCGR_PEP_ID=MMETSP1081-20130531/81009_1 /TAXON_ID=36882 /ORGANISM="Pyramimonas amylifera, Strain CCMP720" /LENGTH=270 /DNA_ID=CAMNT_0041919957 /DNA_START=128 /DNA_END=940 /DNA_ORIENTATION=-
MKFFNFGKSKSSAPSGSPAAGSSVTDMARLEADEGPPPQCPFADMMKNPRDHPVGTRCPFHTHLAVGPSKLADSVTPLVVVRSTHQPSDGTGALLKDIGGGDRIREFCTRFYARAFEDKVIKQFFFELDGASEHGQRLADWIVEKMGGEGTPWSDSGRHGGRQAAHHQAWNSFKRHDAVKGDHFQLDDTRIWMRLHFWAVRETGVADHHGFMQWYIGFIRHFISVYERKAPAYAAESAEWSANEENIALYKKNNNYMADVISPMRPGYGP